MSAMPQRLHGRHSDSWQPAAPPALPGEIEGRVLVLSSQLLTDRMLLYSGFFDCLSQATAIDVWATTTEHPAVRDQWRSIHANVAALPPIPAYPNAPDKYLTKLNQLVWDMRLRPPSRVSRMRHEPPANTRSTRALRTAARLLHGVHADALVERTLERLLIAHSDSPETEGRLERQRPDLLIITRPHFTDQRPIHAIARRHGIPSLALITSWDNISTKKHMLFRYDGYLTWSPRMRSELHQFYPSTRNVPSYTVGAPQFDVFFQARFSRSREEFCALYGLRPEHPIIVYSLGSPHRFQEHHGALFLAERIAAGDLGDAQLLVRPHPNFDYGERLGNLSCQAPRVVVQTTGQGDAAPAARSQSEAQIVEWVNTFRHANVVVNLSSTATVDAVICDTPVVNLDYDPEPGRPRQALVKDINHLWTHFKPIAESGGVWLAQDSEEMVRAVRTYLAQPELHRAQRRWVAEYVCGFVDGQCGQRLAEAVLDFLRKRTSAGRSPRVRPLLHSSSFAPRR